MFRKHTNENSSEKANSLVPTGSLRILNITDIKPSQINPRKLFDDEPLQDLLNSIREHGVLVPITVFQLKGQSLFSILDGERRYRCCVELGKEGKEIKIPANVVDPPSKVAGLLYMFSIHNLREQWELMPTALSLKIIIQDLGETDTIKLSRLTGLSQPQIERCKILLEYPEEFQNLSLDPDPKTRIPANFWIEAFPILELCHTLLPELYEKLGRDEITRKLVEKYQNKKIKSVIHFRRIMEAFELSETTEQKAAIVNRLSEYIQNISLETRAAFDEFVMDNRRIQTAVRTCDDFVARLDRSKLDYAVDKEELTAALEKVKKYVEDLLQKLAGEDAPTVNGNEEADTEEGN